MKCAILGGRAAEDVVFNRISTGALNDLERATKWLILSLYIMEWCTLSNVVILTPQEENILF